MSRDKTQRLGRGLAALLGDPADIAAGADVHGLAVQSLEPNPHQPRGPVDPASLEELAASIRAHGILQPLLVRPHRTAQHRYEIVAGERRWRAATAAGLVTIPCLVQPLDDQQAAAAALVENLQRVDLNALEEARGYERLVQQFDITQDVLADAVGKSRSHVANTLRLLRLPDPIQRLVRQGALSAGHARALLSHPDPVVAAEQIVARGLSVRQTEAMTDRASAPASSDRTGPEDPHIQSIEQDLSDKLGLPVRLRSQGGRGSLTLRFSRLEQLDYLLGRLG